MVGHGGSPTRTVHVDMTLTRPSEFPKMALFYVYLLRYLRVALTTDG